LILVDSSVWIDYFRGVSSAETEALETLLGNEVLAVGDIILTEVLQGFTNDRDFKDALRLMSTLHQIDIVGEALAVQAATNFRHLRSLGITVRKTIDTLIATRCIENGLPLLYSDRDFDPFVEHLGLTSALTTLD